MLVRLEFPGGDTAAEDPPNGIGESLYKIRIVKEEFNEPADSRWGLGIFFSENFHRVHTVSSIS